MHVGLFGDYEVNLLNLTGLGIKVGGADGTQAMSAVKKRPYSLFEFRDWKSCSQRVYEGMRLKDGQVKV